MREDQVENGVNFLVHPKVKTAPLSQRISFLENKGLTPQEISAALARVKADDESLSAGVGGDTTAPSSPSVPFPAEAHTPLWRQLAVPGALVMGAVGALGTYYASRLAEREIGGPAQNQSGDSHSQSQSGGVGVATSTFTAEDAGYGEQDDAFNEGAYSQGRRPSSQCHQPEGGAAYLPMPLPFEDGNNNNGGRRGGTGSFPLRGEEASGSGSGSAGEASSLLAGEFRRLTETMEQQTGHLLEAVGAMKTLASRAEQDSSSLLAERVSSHTSELRAELGTIKQLLLLQAGVEGGAHSSKCGAADVAAAGTISANAAGMGVGKNAAAAFGASAAIGGAQDKDKDKEKGLSSSGGLEGSDAQSVKGAADQHVGGLPLGVNTELPANDLENDKSKDADDKAAAEAAALAIGRRKGTARAALATLLAENTPQAAKDGIAMLRMLVANLVNQPNVPRYRRIASSNDNFKKRLLPLEGHRAMMEAVGFKAKGSLWEWTWHEDSDPSASSNNKAVLEDIVKAIDAAVKRPNAPPLHPHPHLSGATSTVPTTAATSTAGATTGTPAPASLVQPATATATATAASVNFHQTMMNGAAQQQHESRFSDAATGVGVGVGAGVTVDAASRGTNRASDGKTSSASAGAEAGAALRSATRKGVLAAAAEVNGVGEGASEAAETAVFSPTSKPGASTGESAVVAAVAAGESQAVDKDKGENSGECKVKAVTVGQGAPPASLAEVAAALQRGDEPPGIRVVEDRLSADAQQSLSASSQPSPPKPWEVFSGAAATATGVMSPAAAKNDGVLGGGVAEDGVATSTPTVNGEGRGYSGGEETRSRPLHAVSVGP